MKIKLKKQNLIFEFQRKLEEIINLDERINRLKKDMNNGDVSPFFISLFGEEMTLNVKLGQSLQTAFGMSFYEQVCKILGESVGFKVLHQEKVLGFINDKIHKYLDENLEDINYIPNREDEIKKIRELSTPGPKKEDPDSTVDVYIITPEKKEILIDITTVKPNKKSFRAMKRKLLKWTAMRFSQDIKADVNAYIAIPYNPQSKDPAGTNYNLWSEYYDKKDLLVGDDLWKLVSNNTFGIKDIIKVFEKIGEKTLKKEI